MNYDDKVDIRKQLEHLWTDCERSENFIYKVVTGQGASLESTVTCLRSLSVIEAELKIGDKVPAEEYKKDKVKSPLAFFSYIISGLTYNIIQYPQIKDEIIKKNRDIVWSYLKKYVKPNISITAKSMSKGKKFNRTSWHTMLCCNWAVIFELGVNRILKDDKK